MKEKIKSTAENQKKTHRGRVWLWMFMVLLVVCGAAAWVLYDGGIIGNRYLTYNDEVTLEDSAPANMGDAIQAEEVTESSVRPACAVIEDTLMAGIVDDSSTDVMAQYDASRIYAVLAQYGCAENAKFFTDMSVRKQTIAEGLDAAFSPNSSAMTSIEYLYSDEKICETIENCVMQNIDTNAYAYDDFLHNANTYSVLYEYGCRDNRAAYSRAAIRELAIAMALTPAEHMKPDEIVTVVEVYKRLGVANLAHLVLQRLKARGYDMNFLLSLEDIIHGIR